MERNESLDELIKGIISEHSYIAEAIFKSDVKKLHGTYEGDADASMSMLNLNSDSVSDIDRRLFCVVSAYMVNLLEPFKDYLQEFHPAGFEVYQSMDSMLSYLRKSEKERKAAN